MNKLLILFFLAFLVTACQTSNDLDNPYPGDIEIYYNYSMDSNQSLKARIKYINKLRDFSQRGSSGIKGKSLRYLKLICLGLKNKQDGNNRYLFNMTNDILTDLGSHYNGREKNILKKPHNKWLANELQKKSRKVADLVLSPDWDSRIYGQWSTQSEYKVEQYQFFQDASFIYTKVVINKGLKENSDNFMGEYRISKTNNSLTLFFKNKNKKSLYYSIYAKRLFLDSKSFYREENE